MNFRKPLYFVLVGLTLTACTAADSPGLKPGIWTGSLTPMNHPDVSTPLSYSVTMSDATVSIDIEGPGGTSRPARAIEILTDRLLFVFDEPEQDVELECNLALVDEGKYEGRCTDSEGKWAFFRMEAPTW